MAKHGLSNAPEYKVWQEMTRRCGRGYYSHVSVDPSWLDFPTFISDMGRRPSSDHTLDRIDGAKGYGPSNCRWATHSVQTRNQAKRRDCLTGSKGVTYQPDAGFRTRIKMHGCNSSIQLGCFDTEEAASLAYQVAVDRFWRLGFVSYPWFSRPRGRIAL